MRQVTAELAKTCVSLGPTMNSEMSGYGNAQDAESASNKLRSVVTARGGDAYVLGRSSPRADGTNVQGDPLQLSMPR